MGAWPSTDATLADHAEVQRLTRLLTVRDAEVAALRECLEDARRWAAHLEAENAAGLAIHQPAEHGTYCTYCAMPYPCETAEALGGDL